RASASGRGIWPAAQRSWRRACRPPAQQTPRCPYTLLFPWCRLPSYQAFGFEGVHDGLGHLLDRAGVILRVRVALRGREHALVDGGRAGDAYHVRLAAEVGGVPDVARLFEGLHNAYGRRIARLVGLGADGDKGWELDADFLRPVGQQALAEGPAVLDLDL